MQTVSALLGLALVLLLSPQANTAPVPVPTVANPLLTALVLGKIGLLSAIAIQTGVFDNILRARSRRSTRAIHVQPRVEGIPVRR